MSPYKQNHPPSNKNCLRYGIKPGVTFMPHAHPLSCGITMPGRGYASITVKASTYTRFLREAERARSADATLDNSGFLDILLNCKVSSLSAPPEGYRSLTRHGGFDEIEVAAARLGILKLLPEINRLYCSARSQNLKNSKPEYLAGASLYIACKQAGLPRTLKEISETTGLDRNNLFSHITAVTLETGFSISRTEPSAFVSKIAENVNSRGFRYRISEKSVNDAIMLLERIKDNPAMEGRNPLTMAAWALYRSSKRNMDNISQKSIANGANIVDANLRKMSTDMRKSLDRKPDLPTDRRQARRLSSRSRGTG